MLVNIVIRISICEYYYFRGDSALLEFIILTVNINVFVMILLFPLPIRLLTLNLVSQFCKKKNHLSDF